VPDVQPTPSNVVGFKAQNVKPLGAQAIVPSKSMQVSSNPQMTPDGHVCCTHRKPLGHEGSCDVARPTTASWFRLSSPEAYLGLLRRGGTAVTWPTYRKNNKRMIVVGVKVRGIVPGPNAMFELEDRIDRA
jgi:hypothetical protein